jgi:hypothetical protein
MSNVPVTIFNTSSNMLSVSVNQGDWFTISDAGENPNLPPQKPNWKPQQPDPNPLSFSTGSPEANTFGLGAPNQVEVNNDYGINFSFQISLPQSGPIPSLQLYLFCAWDVGETVSWVMLNNGLVIASGSC